MHAARHLRQVAGATLLEQEREEVDLEQQVAELVEQLLVVAGERGVGDLVRLFDGVRNDGGRGLLAIPRALAAQALRQGLEREEGLRKALHVSQWSSARASSASWSSPACNPSGT